MFFFLFNNIASLRYFSTFAIKMKSVALEAKSGNALGKLCNSNIIHDLIPSYAATIAVHLVPLLFFFLSAWFQILNYSCFSPAAYNSLIHYCRDVGNSYRGWNNRGEKACGLVKGTYEMFGARCVFTSIFCSFGGKKERTEKRGKNKPGWMQKKRGGEDVYGREVNKQQESWRNWSGKAEFNAKDGGKSNGVSERERKAS